MPPWFYSVLPTAHKQPTRCIRPGRPHPYRTAAERLYSASCREYRFSATNLPIPGVPGSHIDLASAGSGQALERVEILNDDVAVFELDCSDLLEPCEGPAHRHALAAYHGG
jgi:hypothetical protein